MRDEQRKKVKWKRNKKNGFALSCFRVARARPSLSLLLHRNLAEIFGDAYEGCAPWGRDIKREKRES